MNFTPAVDAAHAKNFIRRRRQISVRRGRLMRKRNFKTAEEGSVPSESVLFRSGLPAGWASGHQNILQIPMVSWWWWDDKIILKT